MLFVQCTRDAFGTPDDLRPLLPSLARGSEVYPVVGGDHSFAVSKKSGLVQSDVMTAALEAVVRFVEGARGP
jgi:predicted alpha/beta-hydrolase family hydrolase